MNPAILVTGGSGLLGRAQLRALNAGSELFEIYSVKRKTNSSGLNIEFEAGELGINYSLADAEVISRSYDVEEVIHCAGMPAVFASLRDPALDHLNNFDPILFTARVAQLSKCKVTYISSAEVYGESFRQESDALNPSTFYGLSKAYSEDYLRLFEKYHSISALILRPSIVYDSNLTRNLIYDLKSAFQSRAPIARLFCTLDSMLDFVHAEDIVSARAHLRKIGVTSGAWNVSSDEPISVGNLVEWFSWKFDWYPKVEVVESNFQRKILSSQKLRESGWRPAMGLFDRLTQLLEES